jgi:hypothetical protein
MHLPVVEQSRFFTSACAGLSDSDRHRKGLVWFLEKLGLESRLPSEASEK